MPYGVLQGYTVVIVLLMAMSAPSRYTLARIICWVLASYVLSKLLEIYDAEVLRWSHLVSGHTLKHLAAATAGLSVAVMLTRWTLIEGNPGRVTQPAVPVASDGAPPFSGDRLLRGGEGGTSGKYPQ